MRTIDGAHGEGGGQLVRTACALAAVTGTPIRIINIRARRDPPGLAPQHLAAVRAVAAFCAAELDGAELRSQELGFRPAAIRAGEFRVDVGTAGSITLVLQACLPVAFAAPGPVALTVVGGSDVRAAPPLDYFEHVFLPLLARLGLRAGLRLRRRGYYPRGGGEVSVHTEPGRPQPFVCTDAGALKEIRGLAHCANLPGHIAARMAAAARGVLLGREPVYIEEQVLGGHQAIGPGGAIALWASTRHSRLGAATVAQRGVRAERLGDEAARELTAEIDCGATLDVHAADQVLVFLAQAPGHSRFVVRRWTAHAETAAWLIDQFLPLSVRLETGAQATRVECRPLREL